MISKEMIEKGYDSGIIALGQSPNDDGIVCFIGDNWFYFGGMEAEESKTAEAFTSAVPRETIVQEIFDVLEEFKELPDFQDEYLYYEIFLNEKGIRNERQESIQLFEKVVAFHQENGLTPVNPVSVMHDLSHEINASPDELYTLAQKLIDGIYTTDNPFLYGERITAIQTISENGFYGIPYLEDMEPDSAFDFLLHCDIDSFMLLVDLTAKENQAYYTAEPEQSPDFDTNISRVNEAIRDFQNPKLPLSAQIVSAEQKAKAMPEPAPDKPPVLRNV